MSSWEIGMWKRGGALAPHARLQSGLHWRHRKVDSRYHCFSRSTLQLGDLVSSISRSRVSSAQLPPLLATERGGRSWKSVLYECGRVSDDTLFSPSMVRNESGKTQIWKEKRHFKKMGSVLSDDEPCQNRSYLLEKFSDVSPIYATTRRFFRRKLF